ncbi:MAG TPA: LysR family transcriptional regulator [Afipia sp.]
MDLRQYRYFVAAAELLHFARAAEAMGISPPSMTKQIQEIERDLGVRLFKRTKRSVALTPAGTSFLEDARRVLQQVERAEDTARRAGRGDLGRINIGYIASTSFSGVLQRQISLYRAQQPHVDLKFYEVEMEKLPTMLDDNRLDIAFVRPPMAYPTGIAAMTLLRDPFVVALRQDHRLARLRTIKPSQLAEEVFVLPEQISGTMEVGHRGGFEPQLGAQPGRLTAVLTHVSLGSGIAIVPGTLRGSVSIDGVVYRDLAKPAILSQIAVAFRRNESSPSAKALIAQLRRHASAARKS